MVKIVKQTVTEIIASDYAKAAELIKLSDDIGSNTKAAVTANVRLAYCEVMAQMAKLPSLAKRASDRVNIKKALVGLGVAESKAKRLAENSANFLIKANEPEENEGLPEFARIARDGNTSEMSQYLSDKEIETEAKMVRYIKGETPKLSNAEKIVERWRKLIKDKNEEGRGLVADEAEILITYLSTEGFIED